MFSSQRPSWLSDSLYQALHPIFEEPAQLSSAGYPYLSQNAWEQLRDHVPHLFASGQQLLDLCAELKQGPEQDPNTAHICQVIEQIVNTAGITAPPDLWLLRQVLDTFARLGLSQRLLNGEALVPGRAKAQDESGQWITLDTEQLETDLLLLLARGFVEQYDEGFRIAGHPSVRDTITRLEPLPPHLPSTATGAWRKLFGQEALEPQDLETLLWLGYSCPPLKAYTQAQNHWLATLDQIEVGFRLVPLVLGLRAQNRTKELRQGVTLTAHTLSDRYPGCATGALRILEAAGWVRPNEHGFEVTELGGRGFSRGPGPFGIIETYHSYMANNAKMLLRGRADVWVSRGENVGASQDANRKTFKLANDSLDRFCKDTGFDFKVFIEHAIGRGEATRQRFERTGLALEYVGADLEDAAIDAAIEEQKHGRLPTNMRFVRQADIGRPELLIQALQAAGLDTQGAVMMVGNGFHEARDQTDASMTQIFQGYHEAGILLLFTEENALSVDDLRATAWNTYHAGFKYVHEKSGQCLRPADPRPPVRLGKPLRAAWSECAQQAGYVRLDAYSTRTRTIYPYTPRSGFNPSISVNHFFVPAQIARALGITHD